MYFYAPKEVPSIVLHEGCVVSILGNENRGYQFSHFHTGIVVCADFNGNISIKDVTACRSLYQSEQKEVNYHSELNIDLDQGEITIPSNYIWSSKAA